MIEIKLSNWFAWFRTDRTGTSTVEFGLIAIPFFGLFLAIFEIGFVCLNSVGLQAAVQQASRSLLTGIEQGTTTPHTAADFLTNYVCPTSGQRILPSFVDCTKLIVDVRTAASFANADTSKSFYNTTPQFCPGRPGDITIVRVAYPMPVFLPTLGGTINAFYQIMGGVVTDVPNNPGPKHLLMGTAVFQTETYDGSTYTPPSGC